MFADGGTGVETGKGGVASSQEKGEGGGAAPEKKRRQSRERSHRQQKGANPAEPTSTEP